jgi:hypothetical protein
LSVAERLRLLKRIWPPKPNQHPIDSQTKRIVQR